MIINSMCLVRAAMLPLAVRRAVDHGVACAGEKLGNARRWVEAPTVVARDTHARGSVRGRALRPASRARRAVRLVRPPVILLAGSVAVRDTAAVCAHGQAGLGTVDTAGTRRDAECLHPGSGIDSPKCCSNDQPPSFIRRQPSFTRNNRRQPPVVYRNLRLRARHVEWIET